MSGIKLRLLKPYVNPANLRAALKDPGLALQVLKGTFWHGRGVARLLGIPEGELNQYIQEVIQNDDFNKQVLQRLKGFERRLRKHAFATGATPQSLCALEYGIVRALRPGVVLETGVASGLSSAYILLALEENRKGELHSIDLPYEEEEAPPDGYFKLVGGYAIPNGQHVGWLIPDELKQRWRLALGRSQEVLAIVLEQVKSVDVFLHDSDHSYENMKREYQAVWPYLNRGGLLLSHDINCNQAFGEFSKQVGGRSFIYGHSFGGILK